MNNRLVLIFDGYTSPMQGVTVPAFSRPGLIPEIVARVRKDYTQFDLEVTDKNDPNDTRKTAIIAVGGGSATQGGSSFTGGFYNAFPNDGFVYAATLQDNPKWIADAISHEAGHLFGLSHQAQWTNGAMVDQYRRDGAIMGSPFLIDNPFWTVGQTPSGTTQDDVAILTRVLGTVQPAPAPLPTPPMDTTKIQTALTSIRSAVDSIAALIGGASPDGTRITPPAGTLTAPDGTVWSFGAPVPGFLGGYAVLVNGSPPPIGGVADTLGIKSGEVYARNKQTYWYRWANSSWQPVADPFA